MWLQEKVSDKTSLLSPDDSSNSEISAASFPDLSPIKNYPTTIFLNGGYWCWNCTASRVKKNCRISKAETLTRSFFQFVPSLIEDCCLSSARPHVPPSESSHTAVRFCNLLPFFSLGLIHSCCKVSSDHVLQYQQINPNILINMGGVSTPSVWFKIKG